VNAFHLNDEKPIPLQHIDEALERKQVERLRRIARHPRPNEVAGRG